MSSNNNNNNDNTYLRLTCTEPNLQPEYCRTYSPAEVLREVNKILSQYEGCSAIQANELVLTRCGDETLVKMPSKDSAESAPVLFGVSSGKLFNDKLSFMLTAPTFSSSSSSSSSSAAGTGTAPKAATGPTYPVKLETMAPFNSARNEDHTLEKFIESVNNLLDARGVPKSQQAVSGMALSIKEGKGYAWVNFPTQAASEVAVANLDKSELWVGSGIYVSAKAKAAKQESNSSVVPAVNSKPTAAAPVAAAAVRPKLPSHFGKQQYWFLDMSNIIGDKKQKYEKRIDPTELFTKLLGGAGNVVYKSCFGSVEPSYNEHGTTPEERWHVPTPYWEKNILKNPASAKLIGGINNWHIKKEIRVPGFKEQLVDDCICAHLYKQLHNNSDKTDAVATICTGDGNNASEVVSIQRAIEDILTKYPSWIIHMWSWRGQVNPIYQVYATKEDLKGRFYLSYFDDFPEILKDRAASPPTMVPHGPHVGGGVGGPKFKPPAKLPVVGGGPQAPKLVEPAKHQAQVQAQAQAQTAKAATKPTKSDVYQVIRAYDENSEDFVNQDHIMRIRIGQFLEVRQYDAHEGWSLVYDSIDRKEKYVPSSYIKKV